MRNFVIQVLKMRQSGRRWNVSVFTLLMCGLFVWDTALAKSLQEERGVHDDVQFNPSFINLFANGKQVDLSRFSRADHTLPGSYRADVYVNASWLGRRDVLMQEQDDGKVRACFKRHMLNDFAVDFSSLREEGNEPGRCMDIAALVPGALSRFNSGDQRLDVSIPQKYLRDRVRGYIAPEYWDAGAPFAGFLTYNANSYHTDNGAAGKSTQYYLNANAGLNIDLWRLRYGGVMTGRNDSKGNYWSGSAYAQRDVTSLRSVLTAGDYSTPSDLFGSVPFRGLQVRSDNRMLAESQQGYAPIVRGVAETNAKVSIRQHGNLIYENVVPPGEFSIDDLYSSGYGSDLDVTVTETDGRVRKFVVPYSVVPQMLREDQSRYSFTAGQYRNNSLKLRPTFALLTYQRGISNDLTLYGGAIAAKDYQSAMFGTAFNTPLGALGFDLTQSSASNLPANASASSLQGQSYRMTYSKLMAATNTNVTLAAYRFSTSGYLELNDYTNWVNQLGVTSPAQNKFQLNVNQPLGERLGQVYANGITQNYWNKSGSDTTYQLGYNNSFKSLNLNLSASRSEDSGGRTVNQYMVGVSVPLSRQSSQSSLLSSSISSSSDNSLSSQLNLSGTVGELRNISYNVYGNANRNSNGDKSSLGGASVHYANNVAAFNIGTSVNGSNSQTNAGISGALVFHPGGLTLTQSLGESIAVIHAPGAEGAVVSHSNGVRVNKSGYAVVSSLIPYRKNEISLDPRGMNPDVELQETSQQIVPRAGAIAMVKFNTQLGKPVIVTVRHPNGSSLPVGTTVSSGDIGEEFQTMVGQGGRAFLRGMEDKPLRASWGSSKDQQCSFSYTLPQGNAGSVYLQTESVCSPLS